MQYGAVMTKGVGTTAKCCGSKLGKLGCVGAFFLRLRRKLNYLSGIPVVGVAAAAPTRPPAAAARFAERFPGCLVGLQPPPPPPTHPAAAKLAVRFPGCLGFAAAVVLSGWLFMPAAQTKSY